MRYIELFAGIGGFRLGLEKAFCNKDRGTLSKEKREHKQNNVYTKSKHQAICVFANEWDKYACQIYRKNFGEGELYEEDITKISAESIPDFDLLTAGFPCQSFSIAGKRKGFGDTRGTLFFEICRIAEAKKPNLLLLENVKGLLNHDGGNTFRIILDSLSELGYNCEWEVLNSKNFGVPQNRERVFIVGHLRGKGGQKVFPIGSTMRKSNESSKRQTSGCVKGVSGRIQNDDTYLIYKGAIMSKQNKKWLEDGKELSRNFPQGQRVYSDRGISSTIAGNAGGLGGKTGLYKVSPTLYGFKHGTHKHFNEILPKQLGLIRCLTPTECERLQGFPDGWTRGLSDTQRYKCLGNAVTVNVIEEIGKKIKKIRKGN
ncbi:IS1595 family transposase ISCco3 [subsurface metagenome]